MIARGRRLRRDVRRQRPHRNRRDARLAEAGRSCPHDVAMVGFDDIPAASLSSPPLTTVRQDLRRPARCWSIALLARIEGGRRENGAAPGQVDRLVSRAARLKLQSFSLRSVVRPAIPLPASRGRRVRMESRSCIEKPRQSFAGLWNISFGFFGIQIGFALQNANMSPDFPVARHQRRRISRRCGSPRH